MSKKIVLIDGHSILNRAYYGLPKLTNSEGLYTNAIYGFLNIMFKILEEEKPEYLTVAFDVHAPTFRHEMFAEYKGTRKPMDEELRMQVPVMKEVLRAMNIVVVEHAGWEADDILGTLAKKAQRDGLEVALVSGDRDLLQIADEHIKIRIPSTKPSGTTIDDYYAKDVLERKGVTPEQFIHQKALMGDSSDNIPGVPSVGEKTALGLITQFGSLDGVYEHIDEITKKSTKEKLVEYKDQAYLCLQLARIKTDCDIEPDYENARAEGFYTEEAYMLFKRLNFKNLLNRFEKAEESKPEVKCPEFEITSDQSIFISVMKEMTSSSHDAYVGMNALYSGESVYVIALSYGDKHMAYVNSVYADNKPLTAAVEEAFSKAKGAFANIKDQYGLIGETEPKDHHDVLISSYLLNPLKSDTEVDDIAGEQLALVIPARSEVFGKEDPEETILQLLQFGGSVDDPALKSYVDYFCRAAYVAEKAAPILDKKLEQAGMLELFRDIEMPLSFVLYDMEKEGVCVRSDELKAYGDNLVVRIAELEKSIYEMAGTEFNINSPKQLGEILFDKLGLPGGKKTKTGYSTAADVLEKLGEEYPIVSDILEYRGYTKLKSTYADGLAAFIDVDGRIHSNFNQTITATGRISSTEPNLQNIPTRTELGRQLRKVFVAKDGCRLVDADYSQIELRVLASMSGDEKLIEAYKSHEDIHKITASLVFNVPLDQVTPELRRNAKAVNFGIVYGISSFGLSQGLSMSKKEAQEYIDNYFKTYPGIKNFLDKLVSDAKKKGYSVTMYGRRRPIPELKDSNFMKRSFGERVAMNSPIQGTAADIIKIAMIRVFRALRDEGFKAKLILQVHDELIIEAPENEATAVGELLEREMSRAAEMKVALETDMHIGSNWYEAK